MAERRKYFLYLLKPTIAVSKNKFSNTNSSEDIHIAEIDENGNVAIKFSPELVNRINHSIAGARKSNLKTSMAIPRYINNVVGITINKLLIKK